MTAAVRAAGGVVTRDAPGGPEVVVVHRPQYDDWTLPKGKALPGETDEDCALREVEEETGLVCELGRELPSTSYRDSLRRPKTVRYWTMRVVGGELEPLNEVDEARWLPAGEALELLSYERDIALLRTALAGA
jgi:8-oxo-dGTP diphosphatase